MPNKPEMSVLARTSSIKIPNHTLPRPIQQRAATDIGITLSIDIELVFLTPSQPRVGEARYERQVFRAELPCSHFWPTLGLKKRWKVWKNKWRIWRSIYLTILSVIKLHITRGWLATSIPRGQAQTHCLGPSDREEESIQSKWSTPDALNLWLLTRSLITTINLST